MIKVLYFDDMDELDLQTVLEIISLMPDERRSRALRMREVPQKENAVCFALLLYGLRELFDFKDEIVFRYGENGKPYLYNGPYFNFSHCKSAAACAFSDSEVGVDVQSEANASDAVLERVCKPSELEMLTRVGDFKRLWTQKESILKHQGIGIAGMSDLPELSRFTENEKAYSIKKDFLISYNIGDCSLSVFGNAQKPIIERVSISQLSEFIKKVD